MRESQINLLEIERIMLKKAFGIFHKYSTALSVENLIKNTTSDFWDNFVVVQYVILKLSRALVIWPQWVDFNSQMMVQQKQLFEGICHTHLM